MSGRAKERAQRVDFVFRDWIVGPDLFFSIKKNHIRGFFSVPKLPFVGHIFSCDF